MVAQTSRLNCRISGSNLMGVFHVLEEERGERNKVVQWDASAFIGLRGDEARASVQAARRVTVIKRLKK